MCVGLSEELRVVRAQGPYRWSDGLFDLITVTAACRIRIELSQSELALLTVVVIACRHLSYPSTAVLVLL